jgi:hypothetical protein
VSLNNVQDSIYSWVSGQLNLLPISIPAIWLYPNAPRPPIPYVGMGIVNLIRMCKDVIEPPDTNGISRISALHSMLLNISCYSSYDGTDMQAVDVVDFLRLSLSKNSVIDYLNGNGITLINANANIIFLPAHIASGFEPRATIDVHFGITTYTNDDVGLIKTINGTGELNNSNLEIDYTSVNGG